MKVNFNDLNAQWQVIKEPAMAGLEKLFERSNFILGEEVSQFETQFAEYVGSKYAVGVSNGTDALKLSAQAFDLQGKTCFVMPALTYVATLGGVEQAYPNADYNLIDCDDYFQIDCDLLSEYVRENRSLYDNMIIVPVHLYGYACNMTKICEIANEHNCIILEDSSQAHGTRWNDKAVGSFGNVSAFSLYPGKNLGAAGDAGIITTDDEKIYERLLMLRNLGSRKKHIHEIRGGNHRLDTMQANKKKKKLKHIEEWNEMRRKVVAKYEELMTNKSVTLPKTPSNCLPTHHVYPVLVKDRNKFTAHLDEHNVQWGMHYCVCMEEMPMYKHLSKPNEDAINKSNHMVSLPIHPFMSNEEVEYLSNVINAYKE